MFKKDTVYKVNKGDNCYKKMLIEKNFNDMKNNISILIEDAQKNVVKSINTELVKRNWEIGKQIIEFEQKGEKRAEYGAETLKLLSEELTKKYERGFDVTNLKRCRQFFTQFPKGATLWHQLTWSNLKIILRIKDEKEKEFYLTETSKCHWSTRELERQINSSLYERILVVKDKKTAIENLHKGNNIENPLDVIKDPLVLEFLDLKEDPSYSENDLENEIINKLQEFILELGKGFSFVARQYRMSINNVNYYADLVFYNKYLQSTVIIELKVGKLKPAHLGQLNFYVNYFNKVERAKHENKTIGILICEEKDNAVVEFALPEGVDNIFAVEYKKYLPNKKDLQKKVSDVIKKFK